MAKDPALPALLLIGIPLEWQNAMATSLENAQFATVFSKSRDEAIEIIQGRKLEAVIITSDLIFDDDTSEDMIALIYGKIPTVTLILQETFLKFGQGKVFDRVYNPKALQEYCTVPFHMEELLLHLRIIIPRAQKAALDQK